MRESKRRVRYAVVGLGNIAQVAVLPAFRHARENSELAALVSSDGDKRRILCDRYDVEYSGTYDELEDVLCRARVEAIYVAVPNSRHREITERAARCGAHVLCEKPMAGTEEDCEAMIRVTREQGKKLMIAYRLHFEEANLRVIERILAGEIGEPRVISSVFCHQVREGDVRTSGELAGGALYDLGVYCVNAARYIFRDEPTSVLAQQVIGKDARSREVDEMTTAVLRFPGDRIAQITANQGAADVSEYRVVGTKGDIRLEPAYDYVGKRRAFSTVGGKQRKKAFAPSDQFAPELVYFSRCILEDREPEPSGREGLADVRILQAIVRSAQTGSSVELPPFEGLVRPDVTMRMKKPRVGKVEPVRAPSPSV
jgi:predicted dehydrogenase